MAIEVTCNDIDLLATCRVLHERIGIVLGKAQRLTADQFYTRELLAVEHPGIVLDEVHQVLRIIEAA